MYRKLSYPKSGDTSDFVGLYTYLMKSIPSLLNQISNIGLSSPVICNLINFITYLNIQLSALDY